MQNIYPTDTLKIIFWLNPLLEGFLVNGTSMLVYDERIESRPCHSVHTDRIPGFSVESLHTLQKKIDVTFTCLHCT